MKRVLTFLIIISLSFLVIYSQGKLNSRDLYLDYGKDNNNGKPGTKVTIELMRHGKTYMVAPGTVFYSGDKIRFHFEVNFDGYIAVINKGSSGRRYLLFPKEGYNNRIYPSRDYVLPNKGWITFDDTPGTEELLFVMSSRPIPGVQTSITIGSNPQGMSFGSAANKDQEQEILNELNSRVLKTSRDLVLEVSGDAGYCVTSNQALMDPLGFKLKLIHR